MGTPKEVVKPEKYSYKHRVMSRKKKLVYSIYDYRADNLSFRKHIVRG